LPLIFFLFLLALAFHAYCCHFFRYYASPPLYYAAFFTMVTVIYAADFFFAMLFFFRFRRRAMLSTPYAADIATSRLPAIFRFRHFRQLMFSP